MEDFVFIILASSFMSFISNLLFQKFFIEKGVIDEVKKVEAAQIAVANAVKELQETLKNTVSL